MEDEIENSANNNERNSEGWTRSQTLLLISEYKKNKCLYNPVDLNFVNKSLRSQKLSEMCDNLKTVKSNITVDKIQKKIKSLKTQLWKEKKNILCSKKSGAGAEELYQPKLWCYNELSFLLYSNDAEPSKSNIDLRELGIEEDNLDDSGTSAQIEFSETDSGSTSQHKDRGCPSQTKRKKKSQQLEACGMEALQFMKKFVENKPAKEPAGKEEDLCKYLCGLLKRIQLEETFEELSFKIITLVNQTIFEERKQIKSSASSFSAISHYPSPITPNLSSTPFSIPGPIHFNSHPDSSISASSSKPIYLTNRSPITSPNLTSTPSPINFNSHFESSISTSSSKPIYLTNRSPITSPNLTSTPSPINFNSHFESSISTSSSKPIYLTNRSPITSPNLTSTPSPINFNSHFGSSISTSSSNTTPSFHVPSPEPYLSTSHSPSSAFSRNSFKITSFIPAVPHSNPIPIQESNKPIILQNILIKKSNSTRNVLERAMDGVFDIDDNNL